MSPRGISLQDADTKEMVENISIYRWARQWVWAGWNLGSQGGLGLLSVVLSSLGLSLAP